MIKVGLLKNNNAFLPELDAYRSFFEGYGYSVSIFTDLNEVDDTFDIVVLFMGFVPFWRSPKCFVIVEYHSLSVGKFGRVRDLCKRLINVRGDCSIFLSDFVRRKFWYSKSNNIFLRPMGFQKEYRDEVQSQNKIFDFVYSGTTAREGVFEAIRKVLSLGFSVAVVGNNASDSIFFQDVCSNVTFFGRKSLKETYAIISSSRFGLNFTPDRFPYNVQDSTKVIEYCAFGLGVVTNRYTWVNSFEKEVGGNFLDLTALNDRASLESFNFCSGDVEHRAWERLLFNSGLGQLLERNFRS